jgi:hypothetical protein
MLIIKGNEKQKNYIDVLLKKEKLTIFELELNLYGVNEIGDYKNNYMFASEVINYLLNDLHPACNAESTVKQQKEIYELIREKEWEKRNIYTSLYIEDVFKTVEQANAEIERLKAIEIDED